MNNKIYTNRSCDPHEILRMAEVEARVWVEAQQLTPDRHQTINKHADWLSSEVSRICFVDGACKAQHKFSR